jgi:DNA polymerase III subunit beta
MKFEVPKESLLNGINSIIGVVERKQSMPILSHLLITLSDRGICITGTDLEVQVEVFIDANTTGEDRITLPGRKLFDICRSLPDGSVISIHGEPGKIKVNSGTSKFSLAPLEPNEFPLMPTGDSLNTINIDSGNFLNLLAKTSFSMANQDVRHYLNGVMLQVKEGRLNAVATDGHRLAISSCNLKDDTGTDFNIIIPRKAVIELQKILVSGNNIQINAEKNQISVKQADKNLISKIIEGNFPDYTRVIPVSPTIIVIADRKDLKQSLQRASILSNEKYKGIRININKNQLLISATNPEHEEAEESLEVDFSGDPLEVGFNVSYLIDVLNVIQEDEVTLSLVDSSSSCLISGVKNKEDIYVVMPMRL